MGEVYATRRAQLQVDYNGKDISQDIGKYLKGFTYSESATGKSDTVSFELRSRSSDMQSDDRGVGPWLNEWFPQFGDKVRPTLKLMNWTAGTQGLATYPFGDFTVDMPSGSIFPCTLSLAGTSEPADDAFSATERDKTWENVTVRKFCAEIANRYGLKLVYDADEINIKSKAQNDSTDASFLQSVCTEYGLCLKVYANKLVVFDRERYKKKPPVATLEISDFSSISFSTKRKYTGGELKYADSDGEDVIQAKIGSGKRLLKLTKKADTKQEAERILRTALNNENHGSQALNVTLALCKPFICAGVTLQFNLGCVLDGKYFVDSNGISVGNGGTEQSLGLSLCEKGF